MGLGEDHLDTRVGGHVTQPRIRIVGREREIGGAGREDAPHARHQVGGGLHEEPDTGVGRDPDADQVGAHPFGGGVELSEAEAPFGRDHSDVVAPLTRLAAQQARQRRVPLEYFGCRRSCAHF
ncbi:hypothetical protein Smic_27600 [Streptomyces microflavus]|uniref:Uncharacterized protein n=1 Tax=Streptomyces microflavus TaxID=1919 RepID=A0A7J0CQK1_STRMI|nr:hypothetical protein Smic_27600 [Streptomyces microflavus]